MNIGVAYENGRIAGNLGDCRTFLIVSAEDGNPTGKRLAAVEGGNTTDPVSYTHLDVYKRQVPDHAAARPTALRTAVGRAGTRGTTAARAAENGRFRAVKSARL